MDLFDDLTTIKSDVNDTTPTMSVLDQNISNGYLSMDGLNDIPTPTSVTNINVSNVYLSIMDLNKILEKNPDISAKAVAVDQQIIEIMTTIPSRKRQSTDLIRRKHLNSKKMKTEFNIPSINKFQQHKPSSFFKQTSSRDYGFENREFAELIHNEAYRNYEPAKLKIGKPHPYMVVESRSLVSAEVPDITYKLKLPKKIIDKGILSNVQLEAVVYACQKHDEDFYDDKRLGFLIGDGAGVGKGRTIGGIILENHLHGRKKSIWISVSSDLKQDAERDLGDIGKPIKTHIKVATLNKMTYNQIDSNENGHFNEGVLFVSYSSLISKSKKEDGYIFKKRLDQIIDWFGEDYDGVIVFDECHKAKNLHQNNKTKTGAIVKKLQERLRFARVVYASATGASEPKHMAYMVRLGLWGPGKRFSEFEDFESTLTSLGVGAMELIAIEMKTKGIYLARQLSFQGVEFEILNLPISNSSINGHKFKDVYNKCVEVWNSIYKCFKEAFERNKSTEKDENIFEAQFWSAHQRFFKYLCIAGKIQQCVKIVQSKIKEGDKCVVIGLQSTGEAQTLDILEESTRDIFDFVSSAKGVIKNLIENHYPSVQNLVKNREKSKLRKNQKLRDQKQKTESDTELEEYFESFNKSNTRESVMSYITENDVDDDVIFINEDNSAYIPQSVRIKNENSSLDNQIKQNMLKTIEDIDSMFPFNALDQLIHELGGPNMVAEMTGRKGRILENKGCISYQPRKEADVAIDQINLMEKDRFNNGEKPIAIISDAASTGISLHSDKRFKNNRQRFHITLELPWSADKAVQQFGRTHRSNQVISPHYVFLISDLAGERRFASTIAKRLECLGALTHGDRRCANNKDFAQFNFDNELGLKAIYHLIQSINRSESPTVPFPTGYLHLYGNNNVTFRSIAQQTLKNVGLHETKHMTVTKFLNRILGIDIDMQNALFQYFLDIIENESQKAKARNEFDYGIRDVVNEQDTVYVEETVIFNEASTNDEEIIKIHKIINVEDGVSWEKAFKIYSADTNNNLFCVSKNFENLFLALAIYKSSNELVLITPNFPEKTISKESFESMWEKSEACDIKKDWEYVYDESRLRCLHNICNENCPKRFCSYGQRTKTSYLITGAVFSAFKSIGSVIRKCLISRIELHDGRKLIGAMVSPPYFIAVMKALESKFSNYRCDRFEIPRQLIPESLLLSSPTSSVSTSKSQRNGSVCKKQKEDRRGGYESNKMIKKSGKPINGITVSRINDLISKQFTKSTTVNKKYIPVPNIPKPLPKDRKINQLPSELPDNISVEFYIDSKH